LKREAAIGMLKFLVAIAILVKAQAIEETSLVQSKIKKHDVTEEDDSEDWCQEGIMWSRKDNLVHKCCPSHCGAERCNKKDDADDQCALKSDVYKDTTCEDTNQTGCSIPTPCMWLRDPERNNKLRCYVAKESVRCKNWPACYPGNADNCVRVDCKYQNRHGLCDSKDGILVERLVARCRAKENCRYVSCHAYDNEFLPESGQIMCRRYYEITGRNCGSEKQDPERGWIIIDARRKVKGTVETITETVGPVPS